MKRAVSLFLLLGALIGLFGQAAAFASIPSPAAPTAKTADMSDDCMKMMAEQSLPAKKPCTGMTLDCIAAMGCTVPLTIVEPITLPAISPVVPPVLAIASAQPLKAHSIAPEPEPPSLI